MSYSRRTHAVADKVNFPLAIPATWQTLREGVNLAETLLDFAQVMRPVVRLEPTVMGVEVARAVDRACKPFAVIIFSNSMLLSHSFDADELLV